MQFDQLKRREFITLLGGAAAAWPLVARAQQLDRMRRIGVLIALAPQDPESQARSAAFLRGLSELVALAPDVILGAGNPIVTALLQATRTLPIVFAGVADPVGAGFVASLARPSGNATGFTPFEFSIGGKWLELLKEIAPSITRVAVLRDAAQVSGGAQWGAIQAVAPSLGVELRPVGMRDAGEIESGVSAFARERNGGLIATAGRLSVVHQDLIVALAARHRLPTIYYYRYFVTAGGLVSYGPDPHDQYWRAAGYVDRILRGEKPADLPVQTPTKYELVINLKTAQTLGLDVPPSLLARADEVIE